MTDNSVNNSDLVILRGSTWKSFWASLEQMNAQLEELSIGY
jgi:hypothetical protein